MKLDAQDAAAVMRAAQALAHGDLVAFPTETVYGLGARADDDRAVAKIFAAKGRPSEHPLIVHVASADAAKAFVADDLPASTQRLMDALTHAFWPGPLTVIVPRRPGVAQAAAGGQTTIGLRCPAHPSALVLLRACAALGVPGLAGPSANRFGRVSPTTANHVIDEFGLRMMVLDGGPCPVGIESSIVDLSSGVPVLMRPGVLERAAIEKVLGQPLREPGASAPRASGTLASHYAPRARVRLMTTMELAQSLHKLGARGGQGLAVYSRTVLPTSSAILHRPMAETAPAAAQELFAVLRELDDAGVDLIWVESPPDHASWDGVRDRLTRAAADIA